LQPQPDSLVSVPVGGLAEAPLVAVPLPAVGVVGVPPLAEPPVPLGAPPVLDDVPAVLDDVPAVLDDVPPAPFGAPALPPLGAPPLPPGTTPLPTGGGVQVPGVAVVTAPFT
jgi:hypothetical protein